MIILVVNFLGQLIKKMPVRYRKNSGSRLRNSELNFNYFFNKTMLRHFSQTEIYII